ncbi:uncharacterized protein FOMMEDRAFT_149014 [Fomitiporia mediterranea MF3/22]|uniref:uncharacterized protein n=1 Tax=Fomitiporia mediterranea (strain MF3/22) TaxID=694068 RepID=UPI000440983D|nr:uncharacterized protein FOMMEDRAFT_149014 [Fomitiporia mediterranea MF3/22]EJC98600.1 hypothetical protein FOMMEDRAFT_149014 [Fomitiporia mediterranea MF3/22]
MQEQEINSQELFLELKGICVPLLSHSRLAAGKIPEVLELLSALSERLQKLHHDQVWLKPALLSYAFFPLQTILGRNDSSKVPDQVLEKIFEVFELLFRWWWWTCEESIWEQLLMLCGSILGGLDVKGKRKERDDETKDAVVRLILCLLKDRSSDVTDTGSPDDIRNVPNAETRLYDFQTHARTGKLVPVLGQMLNALLDTAISRHLPLQLHSIEALQIIISIYVPNNVVPSILPGVISSATRIALGRTNSMVNGKGWVNGAVVSAALRLMDVSIVRAIGDEPCMAAGVVKEFNGLEDLTELVSGGAMEGSISQPNTSSEKPYETTRSASWLHATSSQLLMALNSLTPLVSHPTPAALSALASISQSLLSKARLTLPESRPLLLSFLLSLSHSRCPSVSGNAIRALSVLLSPSEKGSHVLLQTLLQLTADNLSALPLLLPTQADARIIHVAGQIEAACRLSPAGAGVGRLLGPTGHIEKWGWRLLSVLDFAPPPATIIGSGAIGLLEGSSDERIVFPMATLTNVATRETHVSLERMLRALGSAGGETCLFAVEWFIRVGTAGQGDGSNVAAFWCASRILEGIVGISLDEDDEAVPNSTQRVLQHRRVEKFARWLTKIVSELWDKDEEEPEPGNEQKNATGLDADEDRPVIEFVKGLEPLQTRFDLRSSSNKSATRRSQPILHKSFALQLMAVSASILHSRFSTLLIHALYPILHSLVQPSAYLAGTAQATLQYATRAVGSATPGNLLLSNFDYALDSVSRRLTRRHLDIDAARVLVVLIRLIGRDVVQRASDVVEECFDRLDDFHGYAIVVEGLVEALQEVVKVIEGEELPQHNEDSKPVEHGNVSDAEHFDRFLKWIEHRNDPPEQVEGEDIGPVPKGPLGKGKTKEMTAEEEEEEKRLLNEPSALDEPPPTPTQTLTSQIVSRSITLLTHGSSSIRTRILTLLASAAPVLPASSLLPAVHRAWPFVINRLSEPETSVAAAAASFVAALAHAHGSFMTQRIWDDVWPLFHRTLKRLDAADEQSALARRTANVGVIGTQSAYTHSHRLYRAMIGSMTAAVRGGIQVQDQRAWDVLLAFRRFLSKSAHEELQTAARELYIAFGENNEDTVWLVLTSTAATPDVPHLGHLAQTKWDTQSNVDIIFLVLESR